MSNIGEESTCFELLQAQAHIWQQAQSYMNSASLKCAVQLGIPDVIHSHGKPMTLAELSRALPINQAKSNYIRHLMSVLVNSGLIVKHEKGDEVTTYGLTPSSRLLLKDEPLSARKFILANLNPKILKPWQALGDWFSNDDPTPFYTTYGMGFWEYQEKDRDLGSFVNENMMEDSRIISKVLMEEGKGVFEGLTSLADVGGGQGVMARTIAQAFPNLKCIVFDLPHIVANLTGTNNLEFVGGDMFESIPMANAILLKWIMHDWSDEDCVKILKRCKEALPSKENGGKVIIIDIVVDKETVDNVSFEAQTFFNMKMVVLNGSYERNTEEWAKLFSDAGFSHYKITPLLGLRSVIEAYP